jgi:hypothetical protein
LNIGFGLLHYTLQLPTIGQQLNGKVQQTHWTASDTRAPQPRARDARLRSCIDPSTSNNTFSINPSTTSTHCFLLTSDHALYIAEARLLPIRHLNASQIVHFDRCINFAQTLPWESRASTTPYLYRSGAYGIYCRDRPNSVF